MFDYIVIGAGSAGCVLASRLSEDPDTNVLLLEAGGPDDIPQIAVPAAVGGLLNSDVDWQYYTEPEPHLNNRKLFWPRGKVLGGSSSINAMVYIRGHRAIYDRWDASGNDGWSYSDVVPFFKKGQHQERGADDFHGVGGPLNVANMRSPNPTSQAFVEACVELGYPRNQDFNGAEQEGVGLYQVTQKNGQRCSSAAAYLRPALDRSNLTVATHAQVTKIQFDGSRASGVSYQRDGETHKAEVRQEIVLCGGAINSPQLLLCSGIGPAKQLAELGIPVVADLPGVGENLQDHLAIFIAHECKEPVSLLNAGTEEARTEYQTSQTGPLTSNIAEAGGFIRTIDDLPFANLQFNFAPGYFLQHGFDRREGHGFTIFPTLLTPESRGRIALRSADPLEAPRIEANYLDAEADMQVLVAGFKIARRLARTSALARYAGAEVEPGDQIQNDDEVCQFIRDSVETLYHPVGTCKMGIDEMAVVDPQLRVRGIAGLRVADASIMPLIPNGNTNAPCIMIGEKAADLIRGTE